MTNILGEAISDWLVSQSLGDVDPSALLAGCCRMLQSAGLPLWRANLSFSVLHPRIVATTLTWWRDRASTTAHALRENAGGSEWQTSPYSHLLETQERHLRIRLATQPAHGFPLIEELRGLGATDYLAFRVPFGEYKRDSLFGSWTTDHPEGFSNADVSTLVRIETMLALAYRVTIKEQATRNVLTTYLGTDAGVRVLRGQIERGDCESIHAVVWYSDLRESTGLAERLGAQEFLAVLNTYFECTAGAVMAEGGEVLLLIGDAVLAIFPIGAVRECMRTEEEGCAAALRAVRVAEQRLREVNAARAKTGQPVLDFGVGLHVGDVMYGNIGVPERLQFTVVGPVANEVARLEGLTKQLGRRVLVSDRFARNLPLAWQPLGVHALRGVSQPLEVFGLPDE